MFRRKNPGKPTSTPTPPKPSKAGRKLVAVDHVEDGLIYRTDGMVVGVVEVSGIPYDMLQVEEQDQINGQFRGFLHMLTFPVALHILSERWDLSPEIGRFQSRLPTDYADVDPAHADQWAQIAHGYAELLSRYTQFLDHVVYWVAVPASTPSQANDHARAVETVLKSLHSDAQPFRPPRDRILMVLANAYGHPLPAPPSAYAAGSVIR
ncbi:MAG: hypothetical protein C7B44_04680 [Sulfobacillus thermosulfidooxidans]|nr:MAG: hypothetical protein C7B44_04680 [Sulfobacillus thermosulfidooxidans]